MLSTTPLEFLNSLGFAYPVHFESDCDAFPLYCGGTCFAVRFRERLYIITATHCLRGREGTPCIIGPDRKRFPIYQPHWPTANEDDNDWADITCISTYGREHWPSLQAQHAVDLDRIVLHETSADPSTFLAVIGYPTSNTEIDVNPPKIVRGPSVHLGTYGGRTGDKHCHFFNNLQPPIGNPDGMSGAPVVKIDHSPQDGFFPTLLGIVTRGGDGSQLFRFIGLNIIIRMLLQLERDTKVST